MSGFSLTLTASLSERDELIAELWDAGTTGITEDDDWVRAFFDEGTDSQALLQRFADYKPKMEEHEDYDWVQHSQDMWQPFPVGDKFWLSPEWVDAPAPEGRLLVPLRPGLACGSGSHPGTRLCLEALERQVRPSSRVLDVGTGSGILAEAAQLLGARFVAGCDIDPQATLIARRNLPLLPVFTGSLRSIRSRSFDIVVANLNAATLGTLASELERVSDDAIIISGFQEEEAARVAAQQKRPVKETLELDGWACLLL